MKTRACGWVCKLLIAGGLVIVGVLVLYFSWGVSLIGALLAGLATQSSMVMGVTSVTITCVLALAIFLRLAHRDRTPNH